MKERLTGAIILVVLIVLLVPELLSGSKVPSAPAPAGVASTSSEEPPLRSYTINLGDDSHSRTEAAGSSGPAMPQPSGPEQPTAQSAQPSAAPPIGTPASGAQTGSVQTGSAQRPVTAPSTAHVPSAPHSPTASAREGAASAPPPISHTTAPTPSPAAPRVAKTPGPKPAKSNSESGAGWTVQLGVFASRDNAERLALDVRVKGFKASVSPVTSGSRKLYRVRVGPASDRSAAQELQARLKASGRPGGTVVAY